MNYRIKKIKTASGERYELRSWDGKGEDRSFWRKRFTTKSDAQNYVDDKLFKERQAKAEMRKNGGDPMVVRTFKDEYQNWKATRYPDLSPGWQINVDRFWRDFKDELGELKIKELTPTLARDMERRLREAGNSRATVQRKMRWIQSVLNYSVQMELLPYNHLAKFKTAKPLKAELQFWEHDDAMSFLKFAYGKYPEGAGDHWKYLVYLVALNTALRSGEIWALRPSCIRKSFGVIHVHEQYDLAAFAFRTLKGKESRSVPLSRVLSLTLDRWISVKKLNPGDLIFSSNGKPIDHNNFCNRVFRKDLKEWGGKPIKFHGLRHTAATLMMSANVDSRTVQAILGHKSMETTMRYSHAIASNVQRAAQFYSLTPRMNHAPTENFDSKVLRLVGSVEPS